MIKIINMIYMISSNGKAAEQRQNHQICKPNKGLVVKIYVPQGYDYIYIKKLKFMKKTRKIIRGI